MNWSFVGQAAVVLCLVFWHPIYKIAQPLVFRFRLRRLLNAAHVNWPKEYHEWKNARNRCASPESAPGEAVGSSPARALELPRDPMKYEGRDLTPEQKECARLEKLLQLADEYEAAPTDKERARLYRKAEALGFTESAFALDEPEQPKRSA